jgi:hypothetical protein
MRFTRSQLTPHNTNSEYALPKWGRNSGLQCPSIGSHPLPYSVADNTVRALWVLGVHSVSQVRNRAKICLNQSLMHIHPLFPTVRQLFLLASLQVSTPPPPPPPPPKNNLAVTTPTLPHAAAGYYVTIRPASHCVHVRISFSSSTNASDENHVD